ncbi:MAG: hypothetical protein Q7R99_03090 [bacterium]|nr:hypothetical protein [bacterium]
MSNIIVLVVFIGSFIGLGFLVFKKVSVLASLPEETLQNSKSLNIALIRQAVLHNRGVGVVGAVMVKTGGKFKTIFANRIVAQSQEEIEKVEKIHQEGDYWQKVETHNFPSAKKIKIRKKKAE